MMWEKYLKLFLPFSILERIDVGETGAARIVENLKRFFQYPRTDRRG